MTALENLLVAAEHGEHRRTARESLEPLGGVVRWCAVRDVVARTAKLGPQAVVVCGAVDRDLLAAVRRELPEPGVLLVCTDPPGLVELIGDVVDDVVCAPVEAGDLRARVQARWDTRVALQARADTPELTALRARCLRLVGHDINNPLTAIRILAEMLSGELHEPEVRQDLEDILEAADLSTAIIESLSGMMRLEGGDDEITHFPLDLSDVVREVVARPFLRNHVRVSYPERGARILGDRRALDRALVDLFLTALRLCEGKGRLSAQVVVDGGWAEVQISHPTMVLSPASQARLVELYGTVPLRSARVPVSAAGLAYADHVARRHGGEVAFRDLDGSVAFAFRLPVAT